MSFPSWKTTSSSSRTFSTLFFVLQINIQQQLIEKVEQCNVERELFKYFTKAVILNVDIFVKKCEDL